MFDAYINRDENGDLNAVPPVPKELFKNVNCHKFILHLLGRISREEMLSDPKKQRDDDPSFDFTFGKRALAISDKPFLPIATEDGLYALARKECEVGRLYLGQIQDAQTFEAAHSFIVERMPGGTFECFDKGGFKNPFSIFEMRDFFELDNYKNQNWRFVPFAQIKAGP